MESDTRARLREKAPRWSVFMLLALLVIASGCATLQELTSPKEKASPEVTVQTAEYGTVTQVTSARMNDGSGRSGEIAITVDTDNGRILIVTQPEDDIYKVGDRVRIVRDDKGFVRVQLVI